MEQHPFFKGSFTASVDGTAQHPAPSARVLPANARELPRFIERQKSDLAEGVRKIALSLLERLRLCRAPRIVSVQCLPAEGAFVNPAKAAAGSREVYIP
ncbi:hypothetical protein LJC59_09325 [Desulfovibrio sp. OttesenSCG-928-A18]|nr:hypothetical protein [Desulfovibrio sp. OttesenSCG-928-A18]